MVLNKPRETAILFAESLLIRSSGEFTALWRRGLRIIVLLRGAREVNKHFRVIADVREIDFNVRDVLYYRDAARAKTAPRPITITHSAHVQKKFQTVRVIYVHYNNTYISLREYYNTAVTARTIIS